MKSPMKGEAKAQNSARDVRDEFRKLLNFDIVATLARMRDANGKVILNSDDLFAMLPQYANHPEQRIHLGPMLYPVAAEITDSLYAILLKSAVTEDDTVVFTAGGSATGKTSILRTAGKTPGVSFIVDTTFSNIARAMSQVELALESGRKAEIHYVYRDFRESVIGMIRRALDPKSGRIVPVDDMGRTHFGAQRAVLELWERYQDNPRVGVKLHENVNGKLRQIKEEVFLERLYASIDSLQELGQIILDEIREIQDFQRKDPNESDDAGGARIQISEAFYEAARSKAKR